MNRLSLVLLAAMALTGCSRAPAEKSAQFLQSGKTNFQKGDFQRAILDFRNAIQATPQEAEPHYQLALACLEVGDPQCAVKELQAATQRNPKHLDARVKLAHMMASGKTKEVLQGAESILRGVLAEVPGDPQALHALALVELKLGNAGDAESRLREALEKAPRNLRIAFNLARLKLRGNDVPGAETILEKAAVDHPKSAAPRLALAEVYAVTGRMPDAERELRKAVETDARDGRALIRLAELLNGQKRVDEAGQLYARASALPDAQFKAAYANFLFWSGKRDQAIPEYEKFYRENPADRAGRKRLSLAYELLGRPKEAAAIWMEALKRNPKDVNALVERARLSMAAGRPNDAESDLGSVLKREPDSAEARHLLSRIFASRGQAPRQIQELGEALRSDSTLLAARTDLTVALLSRNEAAAALQILDQAPIEQRGLLPIAVYRGWAQLALGNKLQARKEVDRALQSSRNRNVLLLDAAYHMHERNPEGARKSIREALEQNAGDLGAATMLVRTYESQPGGVLPELRKYAARVPVSAPVQEFLGQTLLRTRDRAGALEAFQAALKTNPGYAPAHLEIAQLEMSDGKLDAAAARLTSLTAAQPGYLPAILLLGAVEERRSNFVEAVANYRKALQLDGRNRMALNNLSFVLAEYGNQPDEALLLAQKASEISPDDPNVQDTLGWAYYHKGLYPQALQQLRAAVEKSPVPLVKSHLGLTYVKVGDLTQGQKLLTEAVAADPILARSAAVQSALDRAKFK